MPGLRGSVLVETSFGCSIEAFGVVFVAFDLGPAIFPVVSTIGAPEGEGSAVGRSNIHSASSASARISICHMMEIIVRRVSMVFCPRLESLVCMEQKPNIDLRDTVNACRPIRSWDCTGVF